MVVCSRCVSLSVLMTLGLSPPSVLHPLATMSTLIKQSWMAHKLPGSCLGTENVDEEHVRVTIIANL